MDRLDPSHFLDLSQETPLAEGAFRSVYLHPYDPEKIVKVMHKKGMERSLKATRFWRQTLSDDANRREEAVARRLQQSGIYDKRVFPAFFGTVRTSFGAGLLFENMVSRPGIQVAFLRDLWGQKFIIEKMGIEEFLRQYDEIAKVILKAGIVSAALNRENIALIGSDEEGWRVFSFDLKEKSERTLIPMSFLGPWLRGRRAKRRSERQRAKLLKDLRNAQMTMKLHD